MRYTVTFGMRLTSRECTRLSLDAACLPGLSWRPGNEEIGRWARAEYPDWKDC